MQKVIFITTVGIMIGGIAALLTAPRMGIETRERLKASALKHIDKVLEKVEQKLESVHEKALADKKPDSIFT
ncbi:MAG TPA: YtxH domain-containing protein [Saprospiraceae bacterium]|nr:YtxH domain-containing protein [Saprospiraceae bacterium]